MARYVGPRPVYSGRVDHSIIVAKSKADTPVQVKEAFYSAMAGLFPDDLPGSVSALRDALGGTNKAAQAIGVTPRSIQRYIAAEEHRFSQARRADVAKRGGVIRQLQEALAPRITSERRAKIEADGVALTALGSLRVAPDYTEGRFIHWRMQGPLWKPILDAWTAGKKATAATRWNRAFGKSYGLDGARWSYLTELTFEPPN